MNIVIGTPASIPTPPAGEVTLFLDSTNNNILSYKDENGAVFIYNQGNLGELSEDCCCKIAAQLAADLGCALKGGIITATEFQAAITATISVVGSSTDDGQGNKTCSVVIS